MVLLAISRLILLIDLWAVSSFAFMGIGPYKQHPWGKASASTGCLCRSRSSVPSSFAAFSRESNDLESSLSSAEVTLISSPQLTSQYTSSSTSRSGLSPLESWCVRHIEHYYSRALGLKCPFWKRRASDFLDAADTVVRFLIIRHKSLDLIGPPPGWRCDDEPHAAVKQIGMSLQETAEVIRRDWQPDTNKGYYITGRLNTTIYRDDCLFDGPDPDMPVRGLRKYLSAASQLFDHGKSRCELLSLDIEKDVIVARWRMYGILRLPWKPKLPTWTGTTRYHRDAEGLIYCHEESWDVSVLEAFLTTFFPSLARRIWIRESHA